MPHALPLMLLGLVTGCASPGLTTDTEPPKTEAQLAAEAFCAERRGADAGLPPKRFTTDSCTLWPNGDWGQCCVDHDVEYWCGGTAAQRAAADRRLGECVAASGNPIMGGAMHIGTRLGGWAILPTWWRWGYGWYWPSAGGSASR